MSLGVTLCFYLVIGAAVAVALLISEANAVRFGRLYIAATALLFWPLYLPLLLAADRSASHLDGQPLHDGHQQLPDDEMASAITQVELELDAALSSLNGWAEAALSPEAYQFAELRSAWRQQAERIRELDRLLSSNATEATSTAPTITAATIPQSPSANQILASERLRQENLSKLSLVRQQCHDDLMATLAKVRQLVTMIHLAHYTGAPASRAVELVQQIADVVEGLSKGSR